MVPVPTSFKRLFVRSVTRFCSENGEALQGHLLDLAEVRLEEVQRGKIVIGTAGNGRRTELQVFPDYSPLIMAEWIGELLDRYDEARAKLVADGTTSPTDTQISAEILDKLQPVTDVSSDFRNLRYAPEEVTE